MDGLGLRGVYNRISDGETASAARKANESFDRLCSFVRGKSAADPEIAASCTTSSAAERAARATR